MNGAVDHVFVLPSLKTTGGTIETIRLAREVSAAGHRVRIVSMWQATDAVACSDLDVTFLTQEPPSARKALRQLPRIVRAFRHLQRRQAAFVFTHYATYALTPFVAQALRWFFVQDLEWRFVAAGPLRAMLRRFILSTLSRGRVLVANRYLADGLDRHGITVAATATIWADSGFATPGDASRHFDIGMVLRKGTAKRLDLYDALIARLAILRPGLRIVAITPEPAIAEAFRDRVARCLLLPDRAAMRDSHAATRLFVMLSDHEGFGLPPLEAMGAGCVPVVRDAGGPDAYMVGDLRRCVLPATASIDEIARFVLTTLDDRVVWTTLSAHAHAIFTQGAQAAATRGDALAACGFTRIPA